MFALLLAALVILAVLQYEWVGQVSEANRRRLEEGLQKASSALIGDATRLIGTTLTAFQPRFSVEPSDPSEILVRQYWEWRLATPYPGLIKRIFLIRRPADGPTALQELNGEIGALFVVSWPEELKNLQRALDADTRSFGLESVVDSEYAFAMIPSSPITRLPLFGNPSTQQTQWLLLQFNREYLQTEVLPQLVSMYFDEGPQADYRVCITESPGQQIVYQTGLGEVDWSQPDARLAMFGPSAAGRGFRPEPTGQDTVNPVLRDPPRFLPPPPGWSPELGPAGARPVPGLQLVGLRWELLVKHQLGSVDVAVQNIRRRNLTVSLGILVVLGVGAGATILSSMRARALARMQMDFLAGVSHELRTPVSVIRSGCYNISSGAVTEPARIRDYAKMMEQNADRLARMIDQVLLYSRSRSGRARYDIHPVQLFQIVDDAVATMEPSIEQAQAVVVCDISPGLPSVAADSTAMTHCIQNVLSNALKYGRNPTCFSIEIAAVANEHARTIELSITDHGIGISPAELPRIFDAFYRGDHSDIPGNGLGLNLVKQMMDRQGGGITVTSEVGSGSCFTLHIPFAKPT